MEWIGMEGGEERGDRRQGEEGGRKGMVTGNYSDK